MSVSWTTAAAHRHAAALMNTACPWTRFPERRRPRGRALGTSVATCEDASVARRYLPGHCRIGIRCHHERRPLDEGDGRVVNGRVRHRGRQSGRHHAPRGVAHSAAIRVHLVVLLVLAIAIPWGLGPAVVTAVVSVTADNVLLREPVGQPAISPDGGAVEVSIAARGSEAVLQVRDHGVGISPDALPRIFEPSYRAPEAAAHAPGLGLGLSIAAQLVERHGGTVEAGRAEGQGTIVTVRIPLTVAAPEPHRSGPGRHASRL